MEDTGTTADEIAVAVGLVPKLLDQEFPDSYKILCAFAKLIPNWDQFAKSLGLRDQERQGILVDNNLTYPMKAEEVIRKWKDHKGFKGTYRLLIDACLLLEDEDLAKNICKLVKSLAQSSPPQPSPPGNQQGSTGATPTGGDQHSRSQVSTTVNQKERKLIAEKAYAEGVATGLQKVAGQRLGGTEKRAKSRLLDQAMEGSANTGQHFGGTEAGPQPVFQTTGNRVGIATGSSPTTHFAWEFWKLDSISNEINGEGSLIAILDTGINPNHIAFSEHNVVFGKNFVTYEEDPNPKRYRDYDVECHGTSTASIAAGAHLKKECCPGYKKYVSEGIKVLPLGVAPKASLVICRVSQKTSEFDPEAARKALEWIHRHNHAVYHPDDESTEAHTKECILDHHNNDPVVRDRNTIRIVSMSFKLEENVVGIGTLVDMLKVQGVVCIAGAGNDAEDKCSGYPAAYGNVLSVGYNDCVGNRGRFSTVDDKVDVLALGESVLAAFTPPDPQVSNAEFKAVVGTSFAAPAVAGLVALLLQCARNHVTEGGIARTHITNVDVLRFIFANHMIRESTKHLKSEKVPAFFRDNANNLDRIVKRALGQDN